MKAFPAFLKVEYQRDQSGFPALRSDMETTLGAAERRFAEFTTSSKRHLSAVEGQFADMADEARRQLDRALSVDLNPLGSLNLGTEELHRNAEAQRARAVAAREIALATEQAARAEEDYSQSARLAVAASQAVAREEEQALRAALAHAEAAEQVQRALNQTESQMSLYGARAGQTAASNDNVRFGLQNLGYQLGDVSTMWALGAPPMQIFASQSGQVLQAVQQLTGGTSKLAAFMGGPWGIGITAGVIALTPLIGKLWETEDAADAAGNALAEALDRFNAGLPQISALSGVLSEAAKERANALGDLARLNREIASIEAAIANGSPALMANAGSTLTAQLLQAREDRDEAQAKADKAQRTAQLAMSQSRLAERIAARDADTSVTESPSRDTGNRSTRASGLSEEARAYNQAKEAADAYIASLDREIAAIGASPGQLRQLEVQRAKDAAATDEQRQRIEELNAKREEALTLEARREAMARDLKATAQFAEQTLRPLEHELALLGLVGPARARAALGLEEEAFKARLVEQGVEDVNGAWQRYLDLRTSIIEGESAFERERQEAALYTAELDRLVSTLGNLGGVASGVGGLLGILTGSQIGGAAGILLNTTIGTRVDDDGKVIAETLGDELREIFSPSGAFGETLSSALRGGGTGLVASNALFGSQNAIGQLSSAIGGAVGQAAGEELGSLIGGTLGKAAGPLGSILGGIGGSLLGSLFGGVDDANLGVTGVGGRTQARGELLGNLSQIADSLDTSLERMAEALGTSVGSYSLSLGQREDYYRVGSTANFDAGAKRPYGALYNGTDAQAALEVAIREAIKDGAITGLSAAENVLLNGTGGIEEGLKDVLDFRGVFDQLAELRDPVGFAIDELDEQFEHLQDLFTKAGASVAEYASLEELYWIKRDETIERATKRSLSSLESLMDALTIGNDQFSLYERQQFALAEFNPLADRVAAGDSTAYDDFAEAARNLLDIERQIYGSQAQYFNRVSQVTGLSQTALSGTGTVYNEANSPFGSRGATLNSDAGYRDSVDRLNDAIVSGTNAELSRILAEAQATNRNLGALLAQGRTTNRGERYALAVGGGF